MTAPSHLILPGPRPTAGQHDSERGRGVQGQTSLQARPSQVFPRQQREQIPAVSSGGGEMGALQYVLYTSTVELTFEKFGPYIYMYIRFSVCGLWFRVMWFRV
jgi:hypothetical protein